LIPYHFLKFSLAHHHNFPYLIATHQYLPAMKNQMLWILILLISCSSPCLTQQKSNYGSGQSDSGSARWSGGLYLNLTAGANVSEQYRSGIDAAFLDYISDEEQESALASFLEADRVLNNASTRFTLMKPAVKFQPEIGLQIGYKLSHNLSLELALGFRKVTSEVPSEITHLTVMSGTGGTTTVTRSEPFVLEQEWTSLSPSIGIDYYFLSGLVHLGVGLDLFALINGNTEGQISEGSRIYSLDLEGLDDNQWLFRLGPVIEIDVSNSFAINANVQYNGVISDNELPTPKLCGMAGVSYRFGGRHDLTPVEIDFDEETGLQNEDVDSAEDNPVSEEEAGGPVNEAMQEELERRKRIRSRMIEGQTARQEQTYPPADHEAEPEMNSYFDPDSGDYEPTAGKLQAEFFHAVKLLENSDSLMREFRKLSREEAQKVVDALYASSRAASAEYWEDVARHNREAEEEYDRDRARFREEFANEWGRLQWQFLEPILDPAGAAVNLAEESGIIDKSTADAIRTASMVASPSGLLLKGIRKGAKKMLGAIRRNADDSIEDLAQAGSRSVRRNADDFIRGSLRTIENNAGIARQHAKAFKDIARERDWIVVVRKGNPASLGHHCKARHIAKPVTCKAKTAKVGPNAGVVVNPTNGNQVKYWSDAIKKARENGNLEEVQRLKSEYDSAVKTYKKWIDDHNGSLPRGFSENGQGEILYHNNRMYGDYDLHGVFRKKADGTRDRVNFGDGSLGDGRNQQRYINNKLGQDQCQHGGQEDWIKFDKDDPSKMSRADAGPPVVVFKPDGTIIELDTKKDMIDFYKANNLPIPVSWSWLIK